MNRPTPFELALDGAGFLPLGVFVWKVDFLSGDGSGVPI